MDIYDIELTRILKHLNATEFPPESADKLDQEALEKIDSLAKRYGFERNDLIEALMANQITYRLVVGKNPSKMDYYENTLKAFLESLDPVKDVEKLPKKGKNSLHVRQGKIVSEAEKLENLKSLDLKVTFKNGNFVYVIHKYTRDEGGSQGSAKRDAIMTLAEGLDQHGNRLLNLMAILDGDYYQLKKKGLTLIEAEKRARPNALIGTYKTFEEDTRFLWS